MTATTSKVLPVLLAIALVGLSAVGLRLSDPEEKDYDVVAGVVGKPVKVNDGEVTVKQVRVGRTLKENGQIGERSDGMLVVISVTGAATGPKPLNLNAVRLLSGKVSYEGYEFSTGLSAQPGFQTSIENVFEVDPDRIDNLTLEMGSNEVLTGYQQRLRVRLGVTAANAEQWRAAAVGIVEAAPDTTRAIP
jgi:hypothetical protein